MKKYKIYVLRDPRTNEIRYCGYTAGELRVRLWNHTASSRSSKKVTNWGMKRWFDELGELDMKPTIHLIDSSDDQGEALDLEVLHISNLRDTCDMLNIASGGMRDYSRIKDEFKDSYDYRVKAVYQYDLEGFYVDSFNSIKEAAASVNGEKSAISLSANNQDYTKVAYGFLWTDYKAKRIHVDIRIGGNEGNKHSQEALDKMSAAHKGKKWTKEAIAQRSESNSRALVQMEIDGTFIREWHSAKALLEETDWKVYSNRFGKGTQHGYVWVFKKDYDEDKDYNTIKEKVEPIVLEKKTSELKGATWVKNGKWLSSIRIGKKKVSLGYYDTPEESNAV